MSVKVYPLDKTYTIKNVSKEYAPDEALDTMQMSNNISSIDVIGAGTTAPLSCLQSIVFGSNVLKVADKCCANCTSLNTIVFQGRTQSIGASAFFNACSLPYVELPQSLSSIGDMAFSKCSALTSVSLPSSDTFIGQYAFSSTQLQDINVHLSAGSGKSIFSLCNAEHAEVHSNLADSMFNGCQSLKDVKLHGCIEVPQNCFNGCSALTGVAFSNELTSIRADAFNGCQSLTSLDMQNTQIAYVGNQFIAGTSISALRFPKSLSTMEDISSVNFLAQTNVLCVSFDGLDDDYMRSHKDAFSTFGGPDDIAFYSSNGTRYTLNSDQTALNVVVVCLVTVGISYRETHNNTYGELQKMYHDTTRVIDMVKKAYGNNYQYAVRQVFKLHDSTKAAASNIPTKTRILQAIDECAKMNPTLMVFHFSGHGTSSGIVAQDIKIISWNDLFKKFTHFPRLFALLCCCSPQIPSSLPLKAANRNADSNESSDVDIADMFEEYLRNFKKSSRSMSFKASSDDIPTYDTSALFWTAGKYEQATYMEPSVGHRLINALVNTFKASYTWAQQWNAAKKDKLQFYFGNADPQAKSINGFSTSVKVFK